MLTNRGNGSVLDSDEGGICTNVRGESNSQHWLFEDTGGGYYRIVQNGSSRVLEGSTKGEVAVREWSGSDNQKWSVDNVGDGYCCLVHKATGRVLDACIKGKVYCIYWNGAICQQWKLEEVAIYMETISCEMEYNNPS